MWFEKTNCGFYLHILYISSFRIGRKKTFQLSTIITLAMAVGVAFSPSFIVFVILEFFVGAAHHGGFMICCVLSTLEFTLIFYGKNTSYAQTLLSEEVTFMVGAMFLLLLFIVVNIHRKM